MVELATYHWLWKETVNRLTVLHDRVKQGCDLDAAVGFARYVLWSRLDKILEPHDNAGVLKVDSAFMRWKAEELQRAVCERYASGKFVRTETTHLEQINAKLNAIAERFGISIETTGLEMGCGSNLTVITGGVSDGTQKGGETK